MGFYFAGMLFWILIIVGGLFLFLGILSKSSPLLLISGILLILPMLYFWGAENAFKLLAFVPLIPFTIAFFIKKRT